MKRILLFFLLLVGMATAGNAQTKIIMGDMNRDGVLDIADVTYLVDVLLGKKEMQYITRNDFGAPVSGVSLDQTSLTLAVGGTATLTATIVPSDAAEKGVTWTSSNPSVATVSSADGSSELFLDSYGSNKVAVIKAVREITGLGLADAKALVEGELPASLGTFDAATAATHKATLEEAGATVSLVGGGTGGEVTAVAIGTTVITATTVDGGYTATCTVTVGASHEYVDMGNGQLWATCNIGADSPEEYGDYFAWGETAAKTSYSWSNYAWGSSETSLTKYVTDSSYGTVDGKTMLEAGDDAATAWGNDWRTPTYYEWEWLHNNCDWQWTNDYNGTGVKGYIVTSNITSNSIFFPAAGTTEGDVGSYGYYWSSTLVEDNSSWAINMFLHTQTMILGTSAESRYKGLTVRPVCSPRVAVSGIELSASSLVLEMGQTFFPYITATVLPENAFNKNVTWTCSDENVVNFVQSGSNNGYLVPKALGTAIITATTEDGSYTATCKVYVVEENISVTGVSLINNMLVAKGGTATLTAYILPENASNKSVTWTSSDESVATVSAEGVVTGVNYGNATITVTTEDGGYTATSKVQVVDDINGHTYVEMGDGLKWATCNVGANSPEQYGDYFAWGETTPKTEYSWATYKYMTNDLSDWRYINKYQIADGKTDAIWYYEDTFIGDGNTTLDPEDDAAFVNWGDSWRMPTRAEWENLSDTNKFVWTWTDDYNGTGIKGEIVTSKVPGYVGNQIFLPAEGQYGGYWSSSLDVYTTSNGIYFYFTSSNTGCYQQSRSSGRPVRAVSE